MKRKICKIIGGCLMATPVWLFSIALMTTPKGRDILLTIGIALGCVILMFAGKNLWDKK